MKENVRLVFVGVGVVLALVVVSVLGAYVGGRDDSFVSSPVPTAYPTATGNPLDYVDPAELDRLIQNPNDKYVTYVRPSELLVESGPPSLLENYSDDLEGKIQRIRDEGCDCVDVKADEETGSLVFTLTQEQRREWLAESVYNIQHDVRTGTFGGFSLRVSDDYRVAKIFVPSETYDAFSLAFGSGRTVALMANVQLLSGHSGYVWRVDWVDEDSGRVVMSFDSVSEHGHIMRHRNVDGVDCVETYDGCIMVTPEYWQSLFEEAQ